jgi:hypothetical protein
MIAYRQEEMIGSTDLAKSFGGFIDKIANHSLEKIAVMRHNKPEAIIVPIADYERMKTISDYVEDMEIASIILERDPSGNKEGVFDFDAYHAKRMKKRVHV